MSSTFVRERLRGSIETCSPLSPIGTWIKAMFASPSSRCCCCRVMTTEKVSSIAIARKCVVRATDNKSTDEVTRNSSREKNKKNIKNVSWTSEMSVGRQKKYRARKGS